MGSTPHPPASFEPAPEIVVDDPALARALVAGSGPSYLAPWFAGDASVAEAADYLGESIGKVHYWARRWVALGALVEVARVARAGRPIIRYRVAAHRFVVPEALLPETQLERSIGRIHSLLLASLQRAEAGQSRLVVSQPAGHRGVSQDSSRSPRARSALHSSFIVIADDAEARELREELEALRDRWIARAAHRGRKAGEHGRSKHLVVLAEAPLAEP